MTSSLSIDLGTTLDGKPFVYDLRDARNILIADTFYSDDFLPYIILPLLENNSPDQLEIVILGSIYNNSFSLDVIPHITTVTDETKFFSYLTDNAAEIQRRSELLLKEKCYDISEYNKSAEHTIPYRIITIGNLQTLLNLDKQLTLQSLDLICKYGPHVGVFLIATIEQPDHLSTQIIDLFHTKLIFPQFDEEAFLRLTNDTHTPPLLRWSIKEHTYDKAMLYTNNTLFAKFKIKFLLSTKRQEIAKNIINRYTPHPALPLNLGIISDNTDYIYDLRNTNGIIITGHVGSGKETLLNRFITSLAQNFTQNMCQFLLIDPLGHDQEVFNNLPHLVKPIIKLDMDIAVKELQLQIQEILHRYDLLIKSGCFNIDHYNSITKDKMPFRIITINQFSELFCTNTQTPHWNNIIINNIQTIVKLGPTVGIYLIISTHPCVLTKDLHQLFNTKISFQARDKSDSIRMLGLPGAETLQSFGEALFYPKDTIPTKITIPYLSDDEISDIVKKLQN